jgi:hypothetical protein
MVMVMAPGRSWVKVAELAAGQGALYTVLLHFINLK